MLNDINTSYNETANNEEQYRRFRQKQSRYEILKEDLVIADSSAKTKGAGGENIIRPGRRGIIMP